MPKSARCLLSSLRADLILDLALLVTYVKVIKQAAANPYWFDLFMDKLFKASPVQIQVVDDHLNLNLEDDDDIVNEAEDTITIMSKYIDQMPDTVPKKRLDNLMRSLYNEALSVGM